MRHDHFLTESWSAVNDVFALPSRLAAKSVPELVADDARHLDRVATAIEHMIDDLAERLDAARRAPGRSGQAAYERDAEIRRLSGRLRVLRRFGLDVCLGRMVHDSGEITYVGRVGVSDTAGERLLVDWRSPAAEPFFGATHANPMGLVSRRRYRWARGRVTDYWDEVFAGLEQHAVLDEQSAFLASLGEARTSRMRDVLATIQSDQDAIIRAPSRGTLVVDGGPGTGKTVVALHRAAYLVYHEPHLEGRGGVLFVGPHRPYLDYVGDVLPQLGEDGVRTCTLTDLVPEGAEVRPERDPEVARLKSAGRLLEAIEPAVAFYEEPPAEPMTVELGRLEITVEPADWVEAFAGPEPGTPHNEAREEVLDALCEIVADKVSADGVAHALRRHAPLLAALDRAWPLVEAGDLVGDLWTVPAYLRRCAPWLTPEELRALRREVPDAWTVEDLPFLDAARARLGDASAAARRRRERLSFERERAAKHRVLEEMLEADHDKEGVVWMLVNEDGFEDAVVESRVHEERPQDPLAGPFAHVVVDEAQELTEAQWRMLVRRCPSRSFTVVGDRAQAHAGFGEAWADRLARVGLDGAEVRTLTISYRTPEPVMRAAEPVIRAVLPSVNVPVAVRPGGSPVRHGRVAELDAILTAWLAAHDDGVACVVAPPHASPPSPPSAISDGRVRFVSPELVKGLEFDLVVLLAPSTWGEGTRAAVDRYVAMTRATDQLMILD